MLISVVRAALLACVCCSALTASTTCRSDCVLDMFQNISNDSFTNVTFIDSKNSSAQLVVNPDSTLHFLNCTVAVRLDVLLNATLQGSNQFTIITNSTTFSSSSGGMLVSIDAVEGAEVLVILRCSNSTVTAPYLFAVQNVNTSPRTSHLQAAVLLDVVVADTSITSTVASPALWGSVLLGAALAVGGMQSVSMTVTVHRIRATWAPVTACQLNMSLVYTAVPFRNVSVEVVNSSIAATVPVANATYVAASLVSISVNSGNTCGSISLLVRSVIFIVTLDDVTKDVSATVDGSIVALTCSAWNPGAAVAFESNHSQFSVHALRRASIIDFTTPTTVFQQDDPLVVRVRITNISSILYVDGPCHRLPVEQMLGIHATDTLGNNLTFIRYAVVVNAMMLGQAKVEMAIHASTLQLAVSPLYPNDITGNLNVLLGAVVSVACFVNVTDAKILMEGCAVLLALVSGSTSQPDVSFVTFVGDLSVFSISTAANFAPSTNRTVNVTIINARVTSAVNFSFTVSSQKANFVFAFGANKVRDLNKVLLSRSIIALDPSSASVAHQPAFYVTLRHVQLFISDVGSLISMCAAVGGGSWIAPIAIGTLAKKLYLLGIERSDTVVEVATIIVGYISRSATTITRLLMSVEHLTINVSDSPASFLHTGVAQSDGPHWDAGAIPLLSAAVFVAYDVTLRDVIIAARRVMLVLGPHTTCAKDGVSSYSNRSAVGLFALLISATIDTGVNWTLTNALIQPAVSFASVMTLLHEFDTTVLPNVSPALTFLNVSIPITACSEPLTLIAVTRHGVAEVTNLGMGRWTFAALHVSIESQTGLDTLFDPNALNLWNKPQDGLILLCSTWNDRPMTRERLGGVPHYLVSAERSMMTPDLAAVCNGKSQRSISTNSMTLAAPSSVEHPSLASDSLVASSIVFAVGLTLATGGSASSSIEDLQLLNGLVNSRCLQAIFRSSSIIVYLLSPFADFDDYVQVWGNVAVSACAVALHAVSAAVVGKCSTSSSVQNGVTLWSSKWWRTSPATLTVQFPYWSARAALLLLPGIVRCGVRDFCRGVTSLLKDNSSSVGAIKAARWSSVIAACLWSVALWRTCIVNVLPVYGDRKPLKFTFQISIYRRCIPASLLFLFPTGQWKPDAERKRRGKLLGDFGPVFRTWWYLPTLLSLAVQMIISVPMVTVLGCTGIVIAAVVVCLAQIVVFLLFAWRGVATRCGVWLILRCLSTLTYVAALIAVAFYMNNVISEFRPISIAVTAYSVITTLTSLHKAFIFLVETSIGQRYFGTAVADDDRDNTSSASSQALQCHHSASSLRVGKVRGTQSDDSVLNDSALLFLSTPNSAGVSSLERTRHECLAGIVALICRNSSV